MSYLIKDRKHLGGRTQTLAASWHDAINSDFYWRCDCPEFHYCPDTLKSCTHTRELEHVGGPNEGKTNE